MSAVKTLFIYNLKAPCSKENVETLFTDLGFDYFRVSRVKRNMRASGLLGDYATVFVLLKDEEDAARAVGMLAEQGFGVEFANQDMEYGHR